MKRDRTFLDFTSLLDITLIILFCFLINFKNTTDSVKAEAAEQAAQAESMAEQLEEEKAAFELEKEEWREKADAELEQIRETDKNAADNAQALRDFRNGTVLTMDLYIESQKTWTVRVKYENILLGEISSESTDIGNFAEELIRIMENNGLNNDDVIIGVLMYDSSDKGSYFKGDFEKAIDNVREVYRQFYCASINIK